MAANCTVIVANHPDSAAEVVGDAGFLVKSDVDNLLRRKLLLASCRAILL
jgi:hypothetical protein